MAHKSPPTNPCVMKRTTKQSNNRPFDIICTQFTLTTLYIITHPLYIQAYPPAHNTTANKILRFSKQNKANKKRCETNQNSRINPTSHCSAAMLNMLANALIFNRCYRTACNESDILIEHYRKKTFCIQLMANINGKSD